MADDSKKKRKARVYGAVAGLSAAEGKALAGMLANPLALLSEIGEKSFPAGLEGLPMYLQEPGFALDARRIRKYLGAPKVPIVIGVEDAMVLKDLVKETPYITMRAPSHAGVAHEIGHSVPSPISRMSQMSSHPLLKALGISAGVGAALTDNETAQAAAPLIAGAPYVPELLEEARATAHGVRGIRAIKGNAEALRALLRLLPAFLSHAAMAAPAVAAPFVAKAVREYVESDIKKTPEKTAAEAPKPPKATGKTVLTARQQWAHPAPAPVSSKPDKPPGTPAAKPPSKSKFYTDMQKMMEGFGARSAS